MRKLCVRGGAFLLILAALLYGVSMPFRLDDHRVQETFGSLYQEGPNRFDAVLIGGSNANSYWTSPYAYQRYGITVCNLGISGLEYSSIRYLIEDARKTQPNALMIITANSLKWYEGRELSKIHRSIDYMQLSPTKIRAVNKMSDLYGFGIDRVRFLFPVFETHANWTNLTSAEYDYQYYRMKAAPYFPSFMNKIVDVSDGVISSDERMVLPDDYVPNLIDLFDYLRDNNIKVLFVRLPQALEEEYRVARLNSICDLIQSYGFTYLDLESNGPELNLDFSTDFYGTLHTNVHGALKFTNCLGSYLVEHYDFEDKRGMVDYKDWDKVAHQYSNVLLTSVLDIELECDSRFDCDRPDINSTRQADGSVLVRWSSVGEVDGYCVYRRVTPPSSMGRRKLLDNPNPYRWERVATLASGALEYHDKDAESGVDYRYTVVPIRCKGSTVSYGQFVVGGVHVDEGE